jgi:hypothetical protein
LFLAKHNETEENQVMKHIAFRLKLAWLACVALPACVMLLCCGLTAFAAEEGPPDTWQADSPPLTAEPPLSYQEDIAELYPSAVRSIMEGGERQIIKTYILTDEQSPATITRSSFARNGWLYELTDITEQRTSETITREHSETLQISTETNDVNEIVKLLAPTLDYLGEDGYSGLLALDLASVRCEAAGYRNSSYTVTATREYPHLSGADTSLIPKTITEKGKTLELDGVTWETQRYTNVDYEDIPESYRAIARYTAKASQSIVTGYTTVADYTGKVSATVQGSMVYTVYFSGSEIDQEPAVPENRKSRQGMPGGSFPALPLLAGLAAAALLAGAGIGVYWFLLRYNVKVYTVKDGSSVLAAKDKISAKHMRIDITPLKNGHVELEIGKFTAKALNGRTLEVVFGPVLLKHKIAYEGNIYKIETDFAMGSIKAIHQ